MNTQQMTPEPLPAFSLFSDDLPQTTDTMITICKQCGGLRASPGESFAGTPCDCRASSLLHWLEMCSKSTPLLTEYDRLKGTNLLGRGSPLDAMIDDATGRFADEAREFFDFCVDMWTRIPSENDSSAGTGLAR